MKKYWIKDLTKNQVIHAPTKEIAEKLYKKFDELGLLWYWGESYLEKDRWEEFKEEACFRPSTGSFGSKGYYEYSKYEVLTIDQLLDFDELMEEYEENNYPESIERYWIKDLSDNQIIHAPTLEIAVKLCEKFHELGLKWASGHSYLSLGTNWKEGICYNPHEGTAFLRTEFGSYEVLSIDQLKDFDETEADKNVSDKPKNIKKYWIKNLSNNQAIHAPERLIAERLCIKFEELGLTWVGGDSYLGKDNWDVFEEKTCYFPASGLYGSSRHINNERQKLLTIDQLLDFDEPFKIEVGKFYKTLGGKKALIHDIDENSFFLDGKRFPPIMGAIYTTSEIWELHYWTEEGLYYEDEPYHELNIVGEWFDEIEFDVSVIPKFKYIAMDRDGEWCLFTDKPSRDLDSFYPNEGNFSVVKEENYPKNYNGSWEDSLHEIMHGKLIKVG